MTVLVLTFASVVFVYFSGLRIWPRKHWVKPKLLFFAETYFVLLCLILNAIPTYPRIDIDKHIHLSIAGFDEGAENYSNIEKIARSQWVLTAAIMMFCAAVSAVSRL